MINEENGKNTTENADAQNLTLINERMSMPKRRGGRKYKPKYKRKKRR